MLIALSKLCHGKGERVRNILSCLVLGLLVASCVTVGKPVAIRPLEDKFSTVADPVEESGNGHGKVYVMCSPVHERCNAGDICDFSMIVFNDTYAEQHFLISNVDVSNEGEEAYVCNIGGDEIRVYDDTPESDVYVQGEQKWDRYIQALGEYMSFQLGGNFESEAALMSECRSGLSSDPRCAQYKYEEDQEKSIESATDGNGSGMTHDEWESFGSGGLLRDTSLFPGEAVEGIIRIQLPKTIQGVLRIHVAIGDYRYDFGFTVSRAN